MMSRHQQAWLVYLPFAMGDNLRLLLRLLYQPGSAMGAILDRGSLLFASAAVLAASLWLKFNAPWLPFSFYAPLLVLAAIYVPGALLLARMGGAGADRKSTRLNS